jgi:hypothetical protein
MAARLSALRADRTLPPGFFIIFKDSWYSFLLEAESTPGPVRTYTLSKTSLRVRQHHQIVTQIITTLLKSYCILNICDDGTVILLLLLLFVFLFLFNSRRIWWN